MQRQKIRGLALLAFILNNFTAFSQVGDSSLTAFSQVDHSSVASFSQVSDSSDTGSSQAGDSSRTTFRQVGDSYYSSKAIVKAQYFTEIAAEKYAREVMQDNECDKAGQLLYKPFNPLLLDGKMLDYRSFSLFSEGVLTVLDSDPNAKTAKPISFYVSIRRDGKLLENKKMRFLNKKLNKISLEEIFAFTKYGDLLIIKPVQEGNWRSKRILKLIGGGC